LAVECSSSKFGQPYAAKATAPPRLEFWGSAIELRRPNARHLLQSCPLQQTCAAKRKGPSHSARQAVTSSFWSDRLRFFGKIIADGATRLFSRGPRDVRDGRWSSAVAVVGAARPMLRLGAFSSYCGQVEDQRIKADGQARSQAGPGSRSRTAVREDGRWSDSSRPSTFGVKILPPLDHGTSSTAAYLSMASVAGGWQRRQPCANCRHTEGLIPQLPPLHVPGAAAVS
jgi:hypothetical protein